MERSNSITAAQQNRASVRVEAAALEDISLAQLSLPSSEVLARHHPTSACSRGSPSLISEKRGGILYANHFVFLFRDTSLNLASFLFEAYIVVVDIT
ncbi:Polyphenol oxidase middle domain [Musa troglodytarum]|uniref:Polyphenol oxidase middle domain n=1 Tax=Musa troglodytarum TaxID=320322 RepID=A0A9E7I6L8_9LILI|nr:Polyphenol oxidase middle domain [Musa troglodytarum]